MVRILFVCHGNICRSPMAEFICRDMLRKRGLAQSFVIASAATSTEEIGNPVYPPARKELAAHGISCDGKRAVQVTKADYGKYDHLICMDSKNIRNLKRIVGADPDGKISLLLDWCGRTGDAIADPWYTGNFRRTYEDIVEGLEGFLEQERVYDMEKSILFINACVRKESRTRILAEKLLVKLDKSFDEIRLNEIVFPNVDEDFLKMRDRLISEGDIQNPLFGLARQFAEAETIVIAAPYWDLSFPAALKQYCEQINVVGITFRYSEDGIPVGLCRANRLFYVSTAGGCYVPEDFGFGYIRALAQNYYGIQDVRKIEAVGLDLVGADVDAIMKSAEASI